VEYKQDEDDEEDEESIGSQGRNDVPAQLPLVRQNASAPIVHLEASDCIICSNTEQITIFDTDHE
jgi:hypothetical protein